MKLYERKLTVNMVGNSEHIDDDALIEMCDSIGMIIDTFEIHLQNLLDDLSAENKVSLLLESD